MTQTTQTIVLIGVFIVALALQTLVIRSRIKRINAALDRLEATLDRVGTSICDR